jgi:hypothetical protein
MEYSDSDLYKMVVKRYTSGCNFYGNCIPGAQTTRLQFTSQGRDRPSMQHPRREGARRLRGKLPEVLAPQAKREGV